jgi:hypothetical protein
MTHSTASATTVALISALALALGACARSPQSTPAATDAYSAVGAVKVPTHKPSAAAMTPAALPLVVVSKNASCGCCGLWVEHMRQAGFAVEVHDIDNLDPIKTRVGVPAGKGSCHTAEVGGYFIEGHVPAADIKRLLAEKPDAKGLVLPGMPMGSPGMEMPGMEQPYSVELVARDGSTRVFAKHE